jgi:AraC-like DNA-binding protein/mannose-6-phosphate isomerase-like protein (cupin superfamily)
VKKVDNQVEISESAYYETKKHSDTMFAFNVYPCTIPTDFTFVPLHWQDSVEIIYVKRGKGTVQVNCDAFTAAQGDIFLVMPGQIHGLQSIEGEQMEYENIIFDLSFLGGNHIDICSQKYLQPMASGKIQLPVHIGKKNPLYGEVSAYLDAADRLCASRPAGYELGVKGRLLLAFSVLFQQGIEQRGKAAETEHVEKLKTVLARIKRDYDRRLTIREMADECGYSESHFMRWFREATGFGFSGYLIRFRLEKAAYALRNSSDTVLQIAEQTGFDNLSNFNRLFRKEFGTTPSRFRKEM